MQFVSICGAFTKHTDFFRVSPQNFQQLFNDTFTSIFKAFRKYLSKSCHNSQKMNHFKNILYTIRKHLLSIWQTFDKHLFFTLINFKMLKIETFLTQLQIYCKAFCELRFVV